MISPVGNNAFVSNVSRNSDSTIKVCFVKPLYANSEGGLWSDNSLYSSVPPFALQLGILLSVNRIFLVISESYHIPRTAANIFAGFLIGPSVLGSWDTFSKYVYPLKDVIAIETIGALTLVYYVFLVGLDMDLKPIKTCHNKKAIAVAVTGVFFSLPIGTGLYYLLLTNMGTKSLPHQISHIRGALIWAFTLSCSEFPEIANILSQLKLLLTENGQLALTASLFSDMLSSIFFLLSVTEFHRASSLSFICTTAFVLLCIAVVQPLAKWLHDKIGAGDRDLLDSQVVFMLHVVLLFGVLSDGLGASSVTGAFLLGVVMPKGVLNNAIQDKVLDFVGTVLMPVFYTAMGERIRIQELGSGVSWVTVVIVILLASLAKVLSTLLVTRIYQMPLKDGFTLGVLMNTKGPLSLIILSIARDRIQLDSQTYGVMLVACWAMTLPVGPVLASWKKTLLVTGSSQRKTMQGTRPDSPLRLLACVHSKIDANVIINLLKASCPSVKSPIQVVAMELVKMTAQRSREASCLIIKPAAAAAARSSKPATKSGSFKMTDNEDTNKDILSSFDNLSQAIFAEKMRVVSDYNTMHKDIFNVAKHRGVTLILTTLYKQPTYDGLGAGAATARAANMVNKDLASKDEKRIILDNLLKETPCCLAIFVDRGFNQKRSKSQKFAMIYVSGADDREALSYAWRMSRNAEVHLTVVRLVWNDTNSEFDDNDEEYIRLFVRQTQGMPWVRYLEKHVRDEHETVSLLNKMGSKGFDLFLIGRGHGRKMSLAQTTEVVLEEPALGPLGDALADLNSAAESSILVLQRQGDGGGNGEREKQVRSSSSESQCVGGCYLGRRMTRRNTRTDSEAEAELAPWPTHKFIFSTGFM